MGLPFRHTLPPYVYDLAYRSGADPSNVFWWSARQGSAANDGGTVRSIRSWVPEAEVSGLVAEESTASSQPIRRRDRLEFAGDDELDLKISFEVEGFTQVVVNTPSSSGVSICGTSTSTTRVATRWSGKPRLFARSQDESSNGNDAWGVHCPSGRQQVVSVLTGSTASGEAYHVSVGAIDGLEVSSISFSSSSKWHLDGYQIGREGGTVQYYEGSIKEFLLGTFFLTRVEAESLAEEIATRWEI